MIICEFDQDFGVQRTGIMPWNGEMHLWAARKGISTERPLEQIQWYCTRKNISSGLGRFKGKSWKIRMYMHKIGRIVLKRLKWGCNREGTTLFLEGRVPIKKSCCQSSNGSPNLQSIAAMAKSFVSWCTSRIDNDRGNLSQMPSQRIILSIHHIIHI